MTPSGVGSDEVTSPGFHVPAIWLKCQNLRDLNPPLLWCQLLNFNFKVMVFVLSEAVLGLQNCVHQCHCSEMYKRYTVKIFVHLYAVFGNISLKFWRLTDIFMSF